MNFKDESIRFIVYFIILVLLTTLLTHQRVQNSSYLLSDSGIKKSDIQSLDYKTDYFELLSKIITSIFTLDFGKTRSGENVNSHILSRIEPTLTLSIFSIIFGSSIGIICFGYCLYVDNEYINHFFSNLSELILSTPVFLFAIIMFIIFFIELGWLPPGGYEQYNMLYLILPGVSLGIRTFARIFLFGLELGIDELKTNLFFNLRSRGLNKFKIIFKYLLVKVFPTLMILIVMDFSSLLSGAMVVEEIFFYPGIGKSTYTAIKNMDENLLIALLLYSGIVFYLLNRMARFLQSRLITNSTQ